MEPTVFIDTENDFASIKIKEGTEAKSYEKNGFVFCEDQEGNIIEIQILNLKDLSKSKNQAS
jgi:uncharacterized protein YuzE